MSTHKTNSGIYRYLNVVNGKSYVGRSNNLSHRHIEHLSLLRRGVEPCVLLNKAWQKYGEENFRYEILCYCDEDELNDREIEFIEKYDSFRNGYNCTEGGDGVLGYKHTDAAKEKIGSHFRGKTLSDEHRRKMSESQKGRPLTEDHKVALSSAWTHERKISMTMKRSGENNPNYGKRGKDSCNKSAVIASSGEFFFTFRDAARWCGLANTSPIFLVCNGKRQYAGKHPLTGDRLGWHRATLEEIELNS